MNHRVAQAFTISLVFIACMGVARTDDRLKPMWAAISRVDRERLGFTPIPADATIYLEGKQIWGDHYDAMLHVHAETDRTIAFRKVDAGYEWIGEQEIHTGPRSFSTADGRMKEQITITFETQPLSGAPLNEVFVTYHGDDPRLVNRMHLSLAEVKPILDEWHKKR